MTGVAPFGALLLASVAGWMPTAAQLDRLEATLVLPAGARPLSAYDRSYAGIERGGRRLIAGRLVATRNALGKRHVVGGEALVWAADRGCAAVRLEYDPATRTFAGIACAATAHRRRSIDAHPTSP